MFFVCAAFILIQCARFFPTNSKNANHKLNEGKISGQTSKKVSAVQSSNSTDGRPIQPVQKKTAFNLNFTKRGFPLSIMEYVNHYPFLGYQYLGISENKVDSWHFFYHPYSNFMYSKLLGKSDSSLVANNPFDQKKQ